MPGHVERDFRKIERRPAQQRFDPFDGMLDGRRRTKLTRIRIEVKQPPRIDLARLGKLHADNARRAPYDAAAADRRIEDGVPAPRR